MFKFFKIFRNVVFLGWLCIGLASFSIASTIYAVQMGVKVATLTARATTTAISHRRQLAQAVARAKARARLQRLIAAIPIAGLGTVVYFEERDFRDWKEENPDGTRRQYACEVAELTAEVIDDVLQDLPSYIRPEPETVMGHLPECG